MYICIYIILLINYALSYVRSVNSSIIILDIHNSEIRLLYSYAYFEKMVCQISAIFPDSRHIGYDYIIMSNVIDVLFRILKITT